MTIFLSDSGKRFNRDWIFRNFTYTFQSEVSYAITGSNGSGKSTLLQAISGSMMLSEGSISYKTNDKAIKEEDMFRHVSICAPYLELVEEMTLHEFLSFHQAFKKILPGISIEMIIEQLGLQSSANKQIRYYSSGMKQRVKLAQCIFSDTAVVLLDEPCTNLDISGIELYHQLINRYCKERLVIVSSNDETEYNFCKEIISIGEYK